MSKNPKRTDIIKIILSKPNNTLNKTALKGMKKEQLEKLLISLGTVQAPQVEEPPKKTFKKKERKLIEFSDDEKDDDITTEQPEIKEEVKQPEIKEVSLQVPAPLALVPQVPASLAPVPLEREPAQPVFKPVKEKVKPVLIGNPSKKIEKVRKPNIDDIKEDVKDLVAEFSKLITADIRDYKAGEITEDDLIDSHNVLRHEVEDNVAIICSTIKRPQAFDDWVENLLDIIRSKVERVL